MLLAWHYVIMIVLAISQQKLLVTQSFLHHKDHIYGAVITTRSRLYFGAAP